MNSKPKFGLPREIRLKKSSEIDRIFRSGNKITGKSLNIYILESGRNRFAVLVGKKLGNAVQRNRMKRIAREVFRLNRPYFEGKEVIFFIKKFQNDFHLFIKEVEEIIGI